MEETRVEREWKKFQRPPNGKYPWFIKEAAFYLLTQSNDSENCYYPPTRNLSQHSVAAILGISQMCVYRYVKERREVYYANLRVERS